MSERNPTLQDVWRLLGTMNKRLERHDNRFDALERELVIFKADLRAEMAAGFGSLKPRLKRSTFGSTNRAGA